MCYYMIKDMGWISSQLWIQQTKHLEVKLELFFTIIEQ